ncbi:hypothetical protein GIB67_001598 [Kingdonia uniflora]|uniref:DNA-directed RNA polymerase subunit n=1 Tax=Kingdonia uniflora TaxID=39325 RepID=A0A7J7L0S3_9MAGN|nr:hypothetical protein GIB67_001598 [Kingdonia uniflora]
MEVSQGPDFLFCDLCGNLLSLVSAKYAKCSLCGFKKKAEKIVGRETCYTVTAADIRRELGIEPFVQLAGNVNEKVEVHRKLVKETCTKCGHDEQYYVTRQLRSADEGQTVFYECPNCGHSYSENN